MAEALPKYCDHTSVGVIIENPSGELALLKRARFPVGIAPPAGHIDEHGTPEQAAVAEVGEELGLSIALHGLQRTIYYKRIMYNPCRREDGDYHRWSVFRAYEFEGELRPSPDETKGAGWYSKEQLQALADRTKAFQHEQISDETWEAEPGLEEVWLTILTDLGYVR